MTGPAIPSPVVSSAEPVDAPATHWKRIKKTLFPTLLLFTAASVAAVDFHIAPRGNDAAPGTADQPFLTLSAARDAILTRAGTNDSVTVWIHPGRYPITHTLRFGPEFARSKEAAIRFRAIGEDAPVFDGGRVIPTHGARPLQAEDQWERFAPAAREALRVIPVEDPGLRTLLSSPDCRLSYAGRMMRVATYPNHGFGHIDRIADKGAVYAHGRTLGEPPTSSLTHPIGGRFSLLNKDISAWERELQSTPKAIVEGYLSYDWYKERHPIARVKNQQIQLTDYSRYGILNIEKIPRRLRVINLLCELDAPGEFYFDGKHLYVFPPSPLTADGILTVWSAATFLEFDGASHISVEGIVLEGIGRGNAAVHIKSGRHIRLAGCTLRNMSRPAVLIEDATFCGLQSCDLYDVAGMLTLAGGNVKKLIPAGNYAINCHFTQIAAPDYYGNIRIQGVGNIFRNNLVHNFPGQVMTVAGNDHLIERNELFNIGYEEGDGGAIYSGAAMWSWGNIYRHNFLHHLLCIPQAHPRGGIYPDDLDQGDTITQNVFYKAAHRAVLINGGAGHTVTGNLFLNGYIGIYNTQANAEKAAAITARFDSGELKRGDKEDRIWRTEQAIGAEGWNQEPFASRYPRFRSIMNQPRMRFYPIDCVFTNNGFAHNVRNIEYRVGSGEAGVRDVKELPFITATGNREIAMDVFADPNVLDFSYRPGAETGMPAIPFDQIGLTRDAFRSTPPDKSAYRTRVRETFVGEKSFDPEAKYDPATSSTRRSINSGEFLRQLGAFR